MRNSLAACGLCLVFALAPLRAAEEQTLMVGGGPKPCNGQTYVNTWGPNQWGTLYIVGGFVWQGVGRGLRGDVGFQLYRTNGRGTANNLIHNGATDRYRDPDCVDCQRSPLQLTPGNYIALASGDGLRLDYACAMVGAQEDTGSTGPIAPYDYFYNLSGHSAQAFLKIVTERPGAVLDAVLERLTELVRRLGQR